MRDDSIRVVGHVFHEKLIPSSSSCIVGSNGSAAGGGVGKAAMFVKGICLVLGSDALCCEGDL